MFELLLNKISRRKIIHEIENKFGKNLTKEQIDIIDFVVVDFKPLQKAINLWQMN